MDFYFAPVTLWSPLHRHPSEVSTLIHVLPRRSLQPSCVPAPTKVPIALPFPSPSLLESSSELMNPCMVVGYIHLSCSPVHLSQWVLCCGESWYKVCLFSWLAEMWCFNQLFACYCDLAGKSRQHPKGWGERSSFVTLFVWKNDNSIFISLLLLPWLLFSHCCFAITTCGIQRFCFTTRPQTVC